MPYCKYCGEKIDKNAVFCPKCGESLVGEDMGWQEFQIQEEVDEARHRANMYTILAIVLVTVGIMGSSLLFALSSLVGFFGIVFVCLGIGSTSWAARCEHKAQLLKKQLSQ
jgi:uncharacterized membrane protein YvbJ